MVRKPKNPEVIRQYWREAQRRCRERKDIPITEMDDKGRQEFVEKKVFNHLRKCPECRKKVWDIWVECTIKSILEKVPILDVQEKQLISKKLLEQVNEVSNKIS